MAFDQRASPAQYPQNPYGTPSTTIEPTQPYLQQLRSMAHRKHVLVKHGFVVNPLSEADINDKKRCRRCNMRCSSKKNKYKPDDRDAKTGYKKLPLGSGPSSQPRLLPVPSVLTPSGEESEGAMADEKPPKRVLKCQYHTGRVVRMYWTCCRAHVSAPGCTWAPEHLTRTYTPGDLLTRHQYHRTPPHTLLDLLSPSPTPSASPSRKPRHAVAIDCEMGTAYDGESELIRVTLVDYFTSEILLDSLVYPQVAMQHYNTKWSGVSRQQMNDARAKGKCITGGLAAVREAVWRWVGPETVVVGHAVHNDLASLRWIHPLVVDSLLLATVARAEREKREDEEEKEKVRKDAAAAAAFEEDDDLISFRELDLEPQENPEKASKEKARAKRKPGGLSLKALTSEMFNRQIQKGKEGHDSLEDALAARDIVHWFVLQKSAEVQSQEQRSIVPGFW
ncbi:rna exonuclease [Colletotrichum incanum]|uniref:Rna exonuclease n=1 Tax=Colletotrichum incanum TaxID=1573173 RepID=A0A167DYC3_COLIC|nr:rna exonuclease [Colletotrichum incanum]OHW97713.1 RNA exonuclease [Colletotrichum incanum]